MSIFSKVFHVVDSSQIDQNNPTVCRLSRGVAQELVLAAVLSPLMMTDLSAKLLPTVFATDASETKGAIVKTEVPLPVAPALWRIGRKRGGYVRMHTREEALVRKLDFMAFEREKEELVEEESVALSKPLGLRFYFIENCVGAGESIQVSQ